MQAVTKRAVICAVTLYFGVFFILMTSNFSQAAESRPLPANAQLGVLSPSARPRIVIDDQVYSLSAGAQIRNQKNMLIQTASLAGRDVKVLYKKSAQGQIDRIWILTDAEVERISSGAKPAVLVSVTK